MNLPTWVTNLTFDYYLVKLFELLGSPHVTPLSYIKFNQN